VIIQGEVDTVERYYEDLESWDIEFGAFSRSLTPVG
jgi:hypothetical protein